MSSRRYPEGHPRHFHAHVYFKNDTQDFAGQVRERVMAAFSKESEVRVYKPIPQPVGPHPVGMFEIDFPKSLFHRCSPMAGTGTGRFVGAGPRADGRRNVRSHAGRIMARQATSSQSFHFQIIFPLVLSVLLIDTTRDARPLSTRFFS